MPHIIVTYRDGVTERLDLKPYPSAEQFEYYDVVGEQSPRCHTPDYFGAALHEGGLTEGEYVPLWEDLEQEPFTWKLFE